MERRVVLSLLTFVMLLLISENRGYARDMKLHQESIEEKQLDQPYLDGWLKNTPLKNKKLTPNSNPSYLDGWLKNTLDHQRKSTRNSNSAYLDGWLKNTPDENQKAIHNSNQAYLDGWLKDTKDQKEKTAQNSKQVYLDGWLKDTQVEKAKSTPTSDQVYLDGWLKNTNNQKVKSTHNFNQAYLDGWLKDSQVETAKPTPISNQAYFDGWLKETRDLKEKTAHNFNQAYFDGWLKDTQVEKAKSTHNSNQAYLDGWLKNSHTANYKKIGQDLTESDSKLSSKVDHTEAFKLAFFTLDDLYVGNVMTLQFPIREYARFLPRKVADYIPLSKSQLPSLLQLFSLTKDSPQGEDMKDIIDQCEFEPTKGETKACPTSLESMLEFVHSVLGAEARYNIHTTSYPTTSGVRLQNYTILEISKDIYAPKWVACHPRPYPYALYYCHYLDIGSRVFKVLLRGQYGDMMDALGICHLDTSDMNPNHFIFQLLGMKPGEAPLCHFFPVKHIVWAPLPPEATN